MTYDEIDPAYCKESTNLNGSPHPDKKGFESAGQISASLDGWKYSVDQIQERCDLSSLSKDRMKYQLASTGVLGTSLPKDERSLILPNEVLETLHEASTKYNTSLPSLVLFAVHHMLKGFGNGTHTVTASLRTGHSWNTLPQACFAFPTIVAHNDSAELSVARAIDDIEVQYPGFTETVAPIDLHDLVRSGLIDLLLLFTGIEGAGDPLPNFPLVLSVSCGNKGLKLSISFDEPLFDRVTIDSFLDAIRSLLTQAVSGYTTNVTNIELLSVHQKLQLEEWNNTDGDYPVSKRLHHLVEDSARQFPERVAITCDNRQVTYKELNEQANRLAHYLRSMGIQTEQLIGLFLDKSELMIITILAVWKSGAAHVPIDPAYPDERVQFVLDDTKAKVIISSQRHTQRLQSQIVGNRDLWIIHLEGLMSFIDGHCEAADSQNLSHLTLTSEQLAYVTYTSGTTGVPKGIFKEHKSVVNSITDLSVRYGVASSGREVILLFSAYVFEPFVRQMLMALINGQLLAIIDDAEKFDANKLIPFIKKHGVTYLNGTASVLQEYDFSDCFTLRRMILVGENLTDSRYRALRTRFKHRILNEYGFTESAFVTALKIFEASSKRTDTSLGRPLRNVKCYILNHALKRVPVGATGELHIGGLGVSRGYMNRDDLTKRKFISNPFQTEREKSLGVNGLIYKTGDLARWLPNGEVEYLGRADFQIKLRGIRIEPGEIESTMTCYPGIRTSLVVSRKLKKGHQETTGNHLVGYFVCDEREIYENDLLAFLETKLPRYMIPTRLVQLKYIPVTINGKADLRALPVPDLSGRVVMTSKLRNDLDYALRDIWGAVLGVPSESIRLADNFFRLGGHSITCIQLIARIRQILSLEISVEDVFASKTLQNMSDFLRNKHTFNEVSVTSTGSEEAEDLQSTLSYLAARENIAGAYLANSLQQGFVYHYLKNPQDSAAYVMQSLLHYGTEIDERLYRQAWESAQQRFGALRLHFVWEKEVFQLIERRKDLDWRTWDMTSLLDSTRKRQLMEEVQQNDLAEPYKLDQGSLFRVHFFRNGDRSYSCLFSCHHAIMDGWSLPILFKHVHESYLQLLENKTVPNTPDVAYTDCQIHLQRHRNDHILYWAHRIDQIEERCDMNALLNEKSRYKVPLGDYDKVEDQREQTFTCNNTEKFEELYTTCSAEGITLHSVLQFAWHIVLHAYGGGTHSVTGTTISGRNLPVDGIERSVGLFINTLPLIIDHREYRDKTVMTAIKDIQHKVNSMNSRGNVELGRVRNSEMKHELFDTLFVLENYPNLDKTQAEHQRERLCFSVSNGVEKLDYPLAVIARETENSSGFTFTICYAAELFEDNTIAEMLHMVENIFEQIVHNIDRPVLDLEYLSDNQLARLSKWNSTDDEFPVTTLHQLFEIEAQRVPEKIAVVYEDSKLTYKELNERANKMANYLRTLTVIQPDNLIALFTEKSEHMIVSILAVWKTGAAYVPIDTNYPDDRVQYILSDTSSLAVITDSQYIGRIKALSAINSSLHIVKSDVALELGPQFSNSNLGPTSVNTDLAYIIYTSGTTGKPKGVMVEHRGVVNLQISLSKIFSLRAMDDEVILSFSNYVFDHFIEQMTDALLNGQTLVMLNDAMRGDKERLYNYIARNRVTYLSGTPSVVSMYEFSRFKDHLRRVDCVGEAFSEPVFDKIRETFSGLIINGYGPTEVSITTSKRLYPYPERRTDKSIGEMVANIRSYVLDENMKLVPIGAVGELYLGGVGVSRGYHNRSDLTQERFPLNPFQTSEEKRLGINGRLYKTGDLVRWIPNSNGEVEYLGRNDFQVKIRGLRIELGEIEAILSSFPDISQSVVVAKDYVNDKTSESHKYLVGYFVSHVALSSHDIRRFMQSKLPDYMIPTRLIQIEKVPTTVSGKLDSKALPSAEYVTDDDYMAPRSDVELALCGIWSELLDIPSETISIYSDFFSLGGDSLKSTKLSFMLTKYFGIEVSVRNVFNNRTVEAMAHLIINHVVESDEICPLPEGITNIPASLAQERLLFIHEFEKGGSAYNIAIHLQISNQTNEVQLVESLRFLLARHESLRTLLVKSPETGQYLQKVVDKNEAQSMLLIRSDCVRDVVSLEDRLNQIEKYVFRLDTELPLQIYIHRVLQGSDNITLSFLVHHASFDAWSWTILLRDLKEYYAYLSGSTPKANLPPLKIQYKEYAIEQRKHLSAGYGNDLKEFWERKLEGFEQLHLVTDYPRPANFDYQGSDISLELNNNITESLIHLAKQEKVSLYCLLLAIYCLLLRSYTNQTDIVVGVPAANRNRPEFENIVGFFVNMLVLRTDLSSPTTVTEVIQQVHGELIDVQLHQDLPFQEIVNALQIARDSSRHPIVQTIFNFESADTDTDLVPESGLQFSQYKTTNAHECFAKFDLNATITVTRSGLKINFNFATSLFARETVYGILQTYENLLRQVAVSHTDGTIPLETLQLVSPEQEYIVATQRKHDDEIEMKLYEKTLSQTFEKEAQRVPDRVAIVQGDRALTYRDLNVQANQLARYLEQVLVRVRPEDKIALMLEKSVETIISILAVWKIGACYVPLDPAYPDERVRFIVEEAQPKLIVSSGSEASRMQNLNKDTRCIDLSLERSIAHQREDNLDAKSWPSNLAYIIYTSGTTGKPKGVLVEQRGVLDLRNALKSKYFGADESEQETILFLSNYVFDFSLEQLVLSILSGNKLLIPPPDFWAKDEFYEQANMNKLSYLSGTPSVLHQVELSRLSYLKMVTAAGEEFRAHQFEKMRRSFGGIINNAYGITETTVYNIVSTYPKDAPFDGTLHQLLPLTKAYVLNDYFQRLPVGAIGELYLSGACVARGYLDRLELTSERFLANPFRTDDEIAKGHYTRLYKTGDLVRCRRDGHLEYMGRNDQQVKLNGYRIELGEIKDALSSFEKVEDCAVVARHVADSKHAHVAQYIAGYYTSTHDTASLEKEIFEFLKQRLPQYMVPARLYRVQGRLPVTVNGKLDTRRLPIADIAPTANSYNAPRNVLEMKLCQVWSSLLDIQRCGIDDDFFKLGGNSISSLQLVARIYRELQQKVTVKDIFDHRTVRSLHDNVLLNEKTGSHARSYRAEQGLVTGESPLLPIQNWFLAKQLVNQNYWNHTFSIRTPELDVNKLEAAVRKLQDYHDAFRIRISRVDGAYIQSFGTGYKYVPLTVISVRAPQEKGQIKALLKELESGLRLESGPLFAVAYLHGFNDGSAKIWFSIHHLIVDTVSWQILAQDLRLLYEGGDLGIKGSSLRQWCQSLTKYEISTEEIRYWERLREQFAKQSDEVTVTSRRQHLKYSLSYEQTAVLLNQACEVFDTGERELLVTALGSAMQVVRGTLSSFVTIESHGREECVDPCLDVSRTLGWFTSMYPFEIPQITELSEGIVDVKERFKSVPNNGIGYGPVFGYVESPMPCVSFNYLGRMVSSTSEQGDWKLWLEESEFGLMTDPADVDSSSSAVDITASCLDGCLNINLDSFWSEQDNKQLLSVMLDRICEIIQVASCRTKPVTQPRTDGIHSLLSEHEFIPYFEYRDSPRRGPILFLLPPGEGGAESYFNNIVKHLPTSNLVCFNNYYLQTKKLRTFEELADFYLPFIRAIQPSGPYHLLGWSFGGILSMEIAKRLIERHGEKIGSLSFIDSYFNVNNATRDIDVSDGINILDPIHHIYRPNPEALRQVAIETDRIVFFKASQPNNKYATETEKRLYEYYNQTDYHNLDTLIPKESIDLVALKDDTHFSWVHNEKQVVSICAKLESVMQGL